MKWKWWKAFIKLQNAKHKSEMIKVSAKVYEQKRLTLILFLEQNKDHLLCQNLGNKEFIWTNQSKELRNPARVLGFSKQRHK